MNKPHRSLSFALAALPVLAVLAAVGCVDNTGGPPPPGELRAFSRVAADGVGAAPVFCEADRAPHLFHSSDDVEAMRVASCPDETTPPRLADAAAALANGAGLVRILSTGGACGNQMRLQGFFLDGAALHAWMLEEDHRYGTLDQEPVCLAVAIDVEVLATVQDVAAAASVDVVTGVINPDLADAPPAPRR